MRHWSKKTRPCSLLFQGAKRRDKETADGAPHVAVPSDAKTLTQSFTSNVLACCRRPYVFRGVSRSVKELETSGERTGPKLGSAFPCHDESRLAQSGCKGGEEAHQHAGECRLAQIGRHGGWIVRCLRGGGLLIPGLGYPLAPLQTSTSTEMAS